MLVIPGYGGRGASVATKKRMKRLRREAAPGKNRNHIKSHTELDLGNSQLAFSNVMDECWKLRLHGRWYTLGPKDSSLVRE